MPDIKTLESVPDVMRDGLAGARAVRHCSSRSDAFRERLATAAQEARTAAETAAFRTAQLAQQDANRFGQRLAAELEKIRPLEQPGDLPEADVHPAEDEHIWSAGPVGGGEHIVKQGECISSIARDAGHFWETIWNDAANAELREVRKDPNVLLPDDRVHVPPIRPKQEPGETERRHRFIRRGEPAMLRLRVLDQDVPRADEPYTVEIDGETYRGRTDGDGHIRCPIAGNARKALLTVGEEPDQQSLVLTLGGVDPIDALSGIQGRLNNLGFDCGPVDNELGPQTRRALRKFQAKHGLEITGRPDKWTRSKLEKVHRL
jgi:hypothetical protein